MTVLRDGAVVGDGLDTAGLTEADLARLMLGKTVDAVVRPAVSRARQVAAEVTGARARRAPALLASPSGAGRWSA